VRPASIEKNDATRIGILLLGFSKESGQGFDGSVRLAVDFPAAQPGHHRTRCPRQSCHSNWLTDGCRLRGLRHVHDSHVPISIESSDPAFVEEKRLR
jgi:hypothetical protein